MSESFQRREIGKEIYFSRITDGRFKKNVITVNFSSPLSEETASDNAVAAKIMAKCSKKYPTYAELCNKLSSLYAARISSGVLCCGDFQVISFSVDFINDKYALNNEKISEEALDILLDCLFEPLTENGGFSEKFTALEKKTLIEDIEAELNDKQYYASQKAGEIIYKNEPAALRDTGSAESVKRVTAKSAYNAYQRLLKHCRIEIICSGSGDFEDAKRRIIEKFTKLQREDIFPCSTLPSPIKPKPQFETEKMEIQQSKMILAFKTDMESTDAFNLMSEIYGGSPTSKLFLNVREKMSLCYSCWSSFSKTKNTLTVYCGVEKENVQKAQEEILNQLKEIQNSNVTEEELQSAKMYRANSLKAYNDGESYLGAWYLSRIYIQDMVSPEELIQREEKYTKADIVKAAQSLKLDTVYVLTSKE